MFSLLMALTAASAVQAAPATTARTIHTLPGTKIHYYDVAGKTGPAIQKSLKKILAAPAPNTAATVYDWSLDAGVTKRTEGTVCTVTAAKATFNGNVYLPRLKDEARVPTDVLDSWKPYVTGLEKTAADNLWFVVDRLPALEQSLVGKPCDAVAGLWDQAVKDLIAQQTAYGQQLAAAKK